MDESFENKLLKVDLIEIYDDIAAIEIGTEQLIQLCSIFTCSVNLKSGNIVYAVEEKYKNKLSNYKKSKRLKWLKMNLKAIIPNPEEKYIKWQRKHEKNEKISWMRRKLLALDYFHKEPLLFQSEEPCCSHSVLMTSRRRLSQRSRVSSGPLQFSHEISNCSTLGNTSSESVQTVIPSQPKTTLEASPLFNFENVSRSTLSSSSGELPSLCIEGEILPKENEAQSVAQIRENVSVRKGKPLESCRRYILPLLKYSEGTSSQEDAYVTFYQDMHVTSTQEFG